MLSYADVTDSIPHHVARFLAMADAELSHAVGIVFIEAAAEQGGPVLLLLAVSGGMTCNHCGSFIGRRP